jgi:hypothetical protein
MVVILKNISSGHFDGDLTGFKNLNSTNLTTKTYAWGEKYKFAIPDSEYNDINFDYGNIYEIEQTTANQRLQIGPTGNQIDLILQLADNLNPPYFILYVLIVTRLGNEYGRYESPTIDTKEELADFLIEYKEYFETDGRHHIWIGTYDNSGLLIYDQHNVIFAYGHLDNYISFLTLNGFKEQEFTFPTPHIHNFHDDNDVYEERILKHWDWDISPLGENDEYE